MFSLKSKTTLAKAALFQNAPVYVQFYITARCNLTCKQCNIIYANADVREVTIEEIKRIADNFVKIGVAIVLLTGGEPFTRFDLADIIQAFESRGIHVRMQTNGLASDERIQEVVAAGGRDISISLDSLWPANQDDINGGVSKSWHDAIRAMASFTKALPKENSFASLGCVIQRDNLADVEDVIRFGTAISWYSSIVPIHITSYDRPMNFRTFDQSKKWRSEEIKVVENLIERIRQMKSEGYLLYDSDQYLDDIKRFVAGNATTWRQYNKNVCDSPNLYFAVLPNGDFAPCCDHRLSNSISTYAPDFPQQYRSQVFRNHVHKVTSACSGCMYGSYPEMTIAMRYLKAKFERIKTFITSPPPKKWPVNYEDMLDIAHLIRSEQRERIQVLKRKI
jgi:MoaA/NifB/PqqE/SkfB family radical SAM enzyme